jgi:hypothetical protein
MCECVCARVYKRADRGWAAAGGQVHVWGCMWVWVDG